MRDILFEQRDALGVITLNRPGKLNAFQTGMARQLDEALSRLASSAETRVILIRAEGNFLASAASHDFHEGLQAFLTRRPAHFSGR